MELLHFLLSLLFDSVVLCSFIQFVDSFSHFHDCPFWITCSIAVLRSFTSDINTWALWCNVLSSCSQGQLYGQSPVLAHLSRRLTRLAYRKAMLRRPSVVHRPSSVVRPQFQRSSPLKPLGQSKPNFMWSIHRKVERKFI